MKPLVEVKNLVKEFNLLQGMNYSIKSLFVNPLRRPVRKRFRALNGVNFTINKGEFVGLIGHNGSGKSTLLKIMADIYYPTSGKVTVRGKLVPFLELGVGFNPDLSARDNVFLNGTILGMTRKYLESKFDEIIDFADIREFVETPLKNLSSGMQVRLAFSIAIQSKADIYLWDEVLAVGDLEFQDKSRRKFEELRKQGVSVLLVSHDIDEIKSYSDRVIWLDHGQIKMEGDTNKVVDAYIAAYGDKLVK